MEEIMSYALMPSLEHRTCLKIATTLWNQNDIRSLTAYFYFDSLLANNKEKEGQLWQVIEDKVIKKVSQLSLPESLQKKILAFIKPVGLEIFKWNDQNQQFCLGLFLPQKHFWTPQGTIDLKKTAELLDKEDSLGIISGYKLACHYCLENDILKLWNKMPECHRKSFYSKDEPGEEISQRELVIFWTYTINGEVARMNSLIQGWKDECSPYMYAFNYAALSGNKVATEYFLQKLNPKERKESLVETTTYVARRCISANNYIGLPTEYYADILCFLVTQMDEEQQRQVFEIYPFKVLKCFLDWPWQNFFMEVTSRMWDFLSQKGYYCLLTIIIKKVISGYKDCNYQMLFRELWQQSPDTHKSYVINNYASGFLLSGLFKIKDKENIKLILNDITLIEKKHLIFSIKGQRICKDLICSDECDLLQFFIQECISSKSEMIKFQEEFIKCNIWLGKEKHWLNKFCDLLDDLIDKDDKKRSMEEGDSGPAKRLHTSE